MIEIPGYKTLSIRHIVCDYNGTIAEDGRLCEGMGPLFKSLAETYSLHVVTADTFGSVAKELEDFDLHVKILTSLNHTEEKRDYILALGAEECAALGNGNNDELMLSSAALGIAIIGKEGCAAPTLGASDLIFQDVRDALELFLHPRRLVATLRR